MKLNNRRVLVTGADGFIGSHLVEELLKRGCQVRALAYYNSFNHWGWLEHLRTEEGLRAGLEVRTGDIRDPILCEALCEGISVVFHLAALIAIPYSYRAPASYVATNVEGTLNLCQAALNHQCERFVHVSSSEVYGTARYVPIDEAHPLQAQSPYSASKIGAEALAMSYFHSFELPVVVARPFNTFGPRQSARAVIPAIIAQLASGRQELLMGDLRPTRDFNYVLDTCGGLMALAQCEQAIGEQVNLGSGREVSIEALARAIMRLMKREVALKQDPQRLRPEGSEVMRLCSDPRKLVELTNFQPAFTLEDGLTHTIEWIKHPENLKTYKTNLYNV